jgi:hypothetical protein
VPVAEAKTGNITDTCVDAACTVTAASAHHRQTRRRLSVRWQHREVPYPAGLLVPN